MDATKLTSKIFSVIHSIQLYGSGSKGSFEPANVSFIKMFEERYPSLIALSVPAIFSCCKLSSLDFESKEIELIFENWPTAPVADGCSCNKKAGEILVKDYGMMYPTTRCSTHAGSGSIKRLASSKTMCVDEVVTFANGIRPVLKHFQLSGKSTSYLNDALQAMEIEPLKIMTQCPTCMANLLDASNRTVELLFPLRDVLVSCDIKAEERAYFMSSMCLGILHLMADLQVYFMETGAYERNTLTN